MRYLRKYKHNSQRIHACRVFVMIVKNRENSKLNSLFMVVRHQCKMSYLSKNWSKIIKSHLQVGKSHFSEFSTCAYSPIHFTCMYVCVCVFHLQSSINFP